MTGVLELLAGAAIAVAGWRVSVRLWPNARCSACGGTGRNAGSNSQRWGTCRRCGGSGKRLRLGAPKNGS